MTEPTKSPEAQTESAKADSVKRVVRAMCWIPILGIGAELFHCIKWGYYLSDEKNKPRFYLSSIWHGSAIAASVLL